MQEIWLWSHAFSIQTLKISVRPLKEIKEKLNKQETGYDSENKLILFHTGVASTLAVRCSLCSSERQRGMEEERQGAIFSNSEYIYLWGQSVPLYQGNSGETLCWKLKCQTVRTCRLCLCCEDNLGGQQFNTKIIMSLFNINRIKSIKLYKNIS